MSKRQKKQVKTDEEEEKNANANFTFTWKTNDGLVYGDCGTKPSDKILSFDLVDYLKIKSLYLKRIAH